ncbi:MAG: 4Fe-4S dicluster domain-containing protein [Candidatus Promineifilaceae bacterium]
MTQKVDRREFILLSMAGVASAAISSKMKLNPRSSHSEGESPHRWGMVIDSNACIGCGKCTLACRATNDVPEDISWNRVVEVEQQGEETVYATIPCMQCEHAPCVGVCPVGATYQRPDGIVMMDYDRCIGCRYCQMACPYGARSFNWREFTEDNPAVPEFGTPEVERRPRGVVEKCSFCYQRIDRGLEMGLTPGVDREATPACVNACPVGARIFGDLNDPDSEINQVLNENASIRLFEDKGTGPRVYYLPWHQEEES